MSLARRLVSDADARLSEILPQALEKLRVDYVHLLEHPSEWDAEGLEAESWHSDADALPAEPSEESTERDDRHFLLEDTPRVIADEFSATMDLVSDRANLLGEMWGDEANPVDAMRVSARESAVLDSHEENLIVLHLLERKAVELGRVKERYTALRGMVRHERPVSSRAAALLSGATELFMFGYDVQCIV